MAELGMLQKVPDFLQVAMMLAEDPDHNAGETEGHGTTTEEAGHTTQHSTSTEGHGNTHGDTHAEGHHAEGHGEEGHGDGHHDHPWYTNYIHKIHKIHAGVDFLELVAHHYHHQIDKLSAQFKTNTAKMWSAAVKRMGDSYKGLKASQQVVWLRMSMQETRNGLQKLIADGAKGLDGMTQKMKADWTKNQRAARESIKTIDDFLKNKWKADFTKAKQLLDGWFKLVRELRTAVVAQMAKTWKAIKDIPKSLAKLKDGAKAIFVAAAKSKGVQAVLRPVLTILPRVNSAFQAVAAKASGASLAGKLKFLGRAIMVAGVVLHAYEGWMLSRAKSTAGRATNAVLRGVVGAALMYNPYVAIITVLCDLILPKEWSPTEALMGEVDYFVGFLEYAFGADPKGEGMEAIIKEMEEGKRGGSKLQYWMRRTNPVSLTGTFTSVIAMLRGDDDMVARMHELNKSGHNGWLIMGVAHGTEKLAEAIQIAKREVPELFEITRNWVDDKLDDFRDWATDFKTGLMDTVDRVVDTVRETASTIKKNVVNTARTVGTHISNAASAAKHHVSRAASAVSSKVSKGWNSAKNWVSSWW
jgi:hypothetical protein